MRSENPNAQRLCAKCARVFWRRKSPYGSWSVALALYRVGFCNKVRALSGNARELANFLRLGFYVSVWGSRARNGFSREYSCVCGVFGVRFGTGVLGTNSSHKCRVIDVVIYAARSFNADVWVALASVF